MQPDKSPPGLWQANRSRRRVFRAGLIGRCSEGCRHLPPLCTLRPPCCQVNSVPPATEAAKQSRPRGGLPSPPQRKRKRDRQGGNSGGGGTTDRAVGDSRESSHRAAPCQTTGGKRAGGRKSGRATQEERAYRQIRARPGKQAYESGSRRAAVNEVSQFALAYSQPTANGLPR